jgi:hypothetical protein
MVFSDPFFWRTDDGKRLEEYDGGIIFVDELDKMDTDVKKCIGEAALSGRSGSASHHQGSVDGRQHSKHAPARQGARPPHQPPARDRVTDDIEA